MIADRAGGHRANQRQCCDDDPEHVGRIDVGGLAVEGDDRDPDQGVRREHRGPRADEAAGEQQQGHTGQDREAENDAAVDEVHGGIHAADP